VLERSLLSRLRRSKSRVAFSPELRLNRLDLEPLECLNELQLGDLCAFTADPGPQFVSTLLGIWSKGACALPLDPALHPERLQARLRRAGATFYVSEQQTKRLTPPGDYSESGLVLFTSGTTGEPRAAELTSDAVEAAVDIFIDRFDLRADDTFVSGVPPYHGLGLIKFLLTPLALNAPLFQVPRSGNRVGNWLSLLQEQRATVTGGTNHTLDLASRLWKGGSLPYLRFVLVGGEPVRTSTVNAFERATGNQGAVRPCYGLTECPSVSGLSSGQEIPLEGFGHPSSGQPFKGISIQIRGENQSTLAPGETGEIWVKGAPTLRRYCDSPEETEARIQSGWLNTGDAGSIDAEGNLFVYGRKKAFIKRAGTTLAPREIEQIAEQVEGVERCFAVGIENKHSGHDLVLFTLSNENDSTLGSRVSQLVLHKLGFSPKRVHSISDQQIPRTASGKVDERRLMELAQTLS